MSEIQKFYSGKTIFITGSSGFMGLCLVEKLLRGCNDLKRLYLLVRPKKGLTPEERVKKYFEDTLFEPLRKTFPDFESKIRIIEGDLMAKNMSMSEKDRNTLIDEVNLIFHNASNVKFEERMKLALKINVVGTMEMINLAKRCKNLQGFMYVSTAYSHCYNENIREEVYESPATMSMVEDLIRVDSATPEGISKNDIAQILGKFPNTYCYTKAIAEGLVDEFGRNATFPCIIYRPAIVTQSWKEPLKNWCNNLNGPTLLFTATGLGIIHTACFPDTPLDMVPVDMSINSIIVAMSDSIKTWKKSSGTLVFNFGSSVANAIGLRRVLKLAADSSGRLPNPSIYSVWPYFFYPTKCIWYAAILNLIFHFIPAVLYDTYLLVNGKKPLALSAIKKGIKSFTILNYFLQGNWAIHITEMNKVVQRMTPEDDKLFFCDLNRLDWVDYVKGYWDGLRLYILKDPISTIPAAEKKMQKLLIVNFVLKWSSILLFIYLLGRYIGLL